ncbi:FAD-dependent oxidoreductase [Thermodesulfobacteriota bacterium]
MAIEQIADKVFETDLLIIGGGVAGCCAAIKARDHGLTVTLLEKANPRRSGSAGMGIDHHGGPFPFDGMDVIKMVEGEAENSARAGTPQPNLNLRYRLISNMFWAFEEMEKLGVPMNWDDGKPYWMPQSPMAMDVKNRLRVHWANIKPVLSREARKRNTNILERTAAVDLLTNNGRVVGATAVNIRTGEFVVIKAKATVISTGQFMRQYDPSTPCPWKYKFKYHFCPASISGDGYAMGYRAGAELVNMEVTGQSSRIRDDLTELFGNIPHNDGIPAKCYTWKGDEISILPNSRRYLELEQKGLTPLYYGFDHLPDDFHKRMDVATADERLVTLKIAQDRDFNRKTHRFELGALKSLGHNRISGLVVDENFKTRVKGLYAIGDSIAGGGGSSGASTMGLLFGESIEAIIKETGAPVIGEEQVNSQKKVALAPLSVKHGTEPLELEVAVRYACERYAGEFKSEGKVREGLRRLGTMKRKGLPRLMAKTPHYLLGCLEARNILEMAMVDMQAILERKETRGVFFRPDYPEKNPDLDGKLIFQRLEHGKPVVELRERVDLKPEYKGGN